MDFIKDILIAFWLFAPAGVSNMMPVLVKKINILNIPLDFYKSFRGKRILGSNKTIRGFLAGILGAIITVYIQKLLYNIPYIRSISLIDYNSPYIWLFGILLGAGALVGDSVESFFKRQLNIAPSKPFVPFDQIDWVLGGLLFSIFYVRLSLYYYLIIFILFSILHPIVNLIGYFIGIKNNKF